MKEEAKEAEDEDDAEPSEVEDGARRPPPDTGERRTKGQQEVAMSAAGTELPSSLSPVLPPIRSP